MLSKDQNLQFNPNFDDSFLFFIGYVCLRDRKRLITTTLKEIKIFSCCRICHAVEEFHFKKL